MQNVKYALNLKTAEKFKADLKEYLATAEEGPDIITRYCETLGPQYMEAVFALTEQICKELDSSKEEDILIYNKLKKYSEG